VNTRPLSGLGGADPTAVAPGRAASADHRSADRSVTVIATWDGRPMAVAVDFPLTRVAG